MPDNNIITFLSLIMIIMIAGFITINSAWAADEAPIGTLIELEGQVYLEGSDASINEEVFLNNNISTGEDSKALILLIDDTEITIGANSSLKIDEYVFDADNTSDNRGRFSVLRGTFLFVSGFITKIQKPDVEITTSYGSIGIRGTTVWGGEVDNDEYGVLVEDGEVTFTNEAGSTNIEKGYGSFIRNRKSLASRPNIWSSEKRDRAKHKVALKNPEIIKKRIQKRKKAHKEMRIKYRESYINNNIDRRGGIRPGIDGYGNEDNGKGHNYSRPDYNDSDSDASGSDSGNNSDIGDSEKNSAMDMQLKRSRAAVKRHREVIEDNDEAGSDDFKMNTGRDPRFDIKRRNKESYYDLDRMKPSRAR
jgi:hypothetical protein